MSPAVQMRILLDRSRGYGRTFEEAWEAAFARVRWPHDTTHRREWKAILESSEQRAAWRAAYEREAIAPRQLAVARIAA